MMVLPVMTTRIDMNRHSSESWSDMQHRMACTFGDGVGLPQRQITIGDDFGIGVQCVSDPPHTKS